MAMRPNQEKAMFVIGVFRDVDWVGCVVTVIVGWPCEADVAEGAVDTLL